MKKQIRYSLIGAAFTVFILAIGFSIWAKTADGDSDFTNGVMQQQGIANVTIGDDAVYQNIKIAGQSSALDILNSLNTQHPELKLVTKEYSGLGTLVQSMYDKENGKDGKYWQYTVNGVMPQVGADKYNVQPNDSIVWKFESSAY